MMFRHPKYYAALRAEKRKLQAASLKQAIQETVPQCDIEEASSSKPQAPSVKLRRSSEEPSEPQAPSASSIKPQASSSMIREPRNI